MAEVRGPSVADGESKPVRLLAIVGSQRAYGNSFLLAREALQPFEGIRYEIVQLAEKEIQFCDLCGRCESAACPLEDDLNEILGKMEEADGILFAFPRYLFPVPTKLLCFLERLDILGHLRRHPGYGEESRLGQIAPSQLAGKPCCLLVVTDSGQGVEECLNVVGNEARNLGMEPVLIDSRPGAHAAGQSRGEVLRDQGGIEECRRLVRNLIDAIK